MTISSTVNRNSTAGDGIVTAFSFPYLFFADDDLTVILVIDSTGVETVQTITTHYTVTGAGVAAGGTVTMVTPPASGETLVIIRKEQFTQGLDLVENDPFPSDLVEQQLDTLTMLSQQLNTEISRSAKLSDGDTSGADPTLSTPVANAYILWDGTGLALTTSTSSAAQYLGGDGTVSLPFYSFSADPDTGIYRIGADNLGLAAGGVKILDVDASGINGAIGATTPAAVSGTTGSFSSTMAITGVLTMGGNIVSDTDSTDDLGTTGVRWANLWVDDVTMTNDLAVGNDVTITGNLTVNGTTVTNDATNTTIKDPIIGLNEGAASNASDLGFIMERGSTGDNAAIIWDESGDYFQVGTTTATPDATGNLTVTDAQLHAEGATFSGTSADLGTVTTVDVNGGTVDGAIIGGASAAAITGTTIKADTSLELATGATVTGILDEDAMGTDSATQLATQQSIKAYVDNSVPENGIKFAFDSATADADQGAGKVWLNHATPASATVLYVDDVEAGSVSVNDWVDSWDDVTNAVARGYVYIASYGTTNALLVYKVTGAVTSAATYSKVPVTHVLTVGTISDADNIGLTFIHAGQDGAGSGDLLAANNLSDVGSAATSRTNLGLAIGSDVEAYDADILKADTADVLTAGFASTPYNAGTKSSGTYTPDEANGNHQYAVNGGAHTLAPPTNNCTLVIQYTNNASAGTITTSGFTLVDGDTISTTNGDDFFFYITKSNGFSLLSVKALQ